MWRFENLKMKPGSLFVFFILLISVASCKKGGVASQAAGKYHGPINCHYDPSLSVRDTGYSTIIAVSYVNENTISINNNTLTFTVANQFYSASHGGIVASASFDSTFRHIVYKDHSGSVYGCVFSGER
jgi:hypothetical protein